MIPARPDRAPADQPRLYDAHLPEYGRAHFAWPVDPQGCNLGAGWIKLRPRDMARFGQLFLQAGRCQDKQVVPAGWVRQATTAQAGTAFAFESHGPFDPQNYGCLWWVDKSDGTDAYFALGYGGQPIEVADPPPGHRDIHRLNLTDPHAATVSPDDTERLVDIIAGLAR